VRGASLTQQIFGVLRGVEGNEVLRLLAHPDELHRHVYRLVHGHHDPTARGGIVVAVHEAIDVPVKFVGVGEKSEDLVPFDAAQYAEDLLSE
jgi:signal recognition particle GTPase